MSNEPAKRHEKKRSEFNSPAEWEAYLDSMSDKGAAEPMVLLSQLDAIFNERDKKRGGIGDDILADRWTIKQILNLREAAKQPAPPAPECTCHHCCAALESNDTAPCDCGCKVHMPAPEPPSETVSGTFEEWWATYDPKDHAGTMQMLRDAWNAAALAQRPAPAVVPVCPTCCGSGLVPAMFSEAYIKHAMEEVSKYLTDHGFPASGTTCRRVVEIAIDSGCVPHAAPAVVPMSVEDAARAKAADTWGHVFQGLDEPCGCTEHRKLFQRIDEIRRVAHIKGLE